MNKIKTGLNVKRCPTSFPIRKTQIKSRKREKQTAQVSTNVKRHYESENLSGII